MIDGTASSQDSSQENEPTEISDASLDDAAGGRIQTVKPTKKGGSVYGDPCAGGE